MQGCQNIASILELSKIVTNVATKLKTLLTTNLNGTKGSDTRVGKHSKPQLSLYEAPHGNQLS